MVTITDLGGRFNLNALAGPDSAENLLRLRRLLEGLSLDPRAGRRLLLDWVDEDAELHEFGAETASTLMADEPFRAANAPAADASEMLVATRLPPRNGASCIPMSPPCRWANWRERHTAGEEVLASLAPNLVRTEVQALVESPREFDSVETFTADHPAFGASVGTLAVASEFFEVHERADILGRVSEIVSTLHRRPPQASCG